MQYGVCGNPIQHSLSPELHAYFGEQLGIPIRYERFCFPIDNFEQGLSSFTGKGLNVTLPFKSDAFRLAQTASAAAQQAQAANVLTRCHAGWKADNTDGAALVQVLSHQKPVTAQTRILLLGAGGAAMGAVSALAATGADVLIYNRTTEKARAIALAHQAHRVAVYAPGQKNFDLVINATSAGLEGQLPAIPSEAVRGAHCLDMLYHRSGQTSFSEWALKKGAQTSEDGWRMFVEQGALTFEIWTGVRPDSQPLWNNRALLKMDPV